MEKPASGLNWMSPPERKTGRFITLLSFLLLVGALSYLNTMYRVAVCGRPSAIYHGVEIPQLEMHRRILSNTAPAPFQYRILSELILEKLLEGARAIGLKDLLVLIWFKALLHLLVFSLAFLFFRLCGLGTGYSLCGIFFIFFAILASYY